MSNSCCLNRIYWRFNQSFFTCFVFNVVSLSSMTCSARLWRSSHPRLSWSCLETLWCGTGNRSTSHLTPEDESLTPVTFTVNLFPILTTGNTFYSWNDLCINKCHHQKANDTDGCMSTEIWAPVLLVCLVSCVFKAKFFFHSMQVQWTCSIFSMPQSLKHLFSR